MSGLFPPDKFKSNIHSCFYHLLKKMCVFSCEQFHFVHQLVTNCVPAEDAGFKRDTLSWKILKHFTELRAACRVRWWLSGGSSFIHHSFIVKAEVQELYLHDLAMRVTTDTLTHHRLHCNLFHCCQRGCKTVDK